MYDLMRRNLKRWFAGHTLALAWATGALVIGFFIIFYCQGPWWLDGDRLRALGTSQPAAQHAALDRNRSQILKIAAGAGAFTALVYTARKHTLDRSSHALDEQAQMTDRYIKAVEQLASPAADVRLGGIYALGRITTDSPADRLMVREVLAAYLRHHSPTTEPDESAPRTPNPHHRQSVDIGASLTVLARSTGERGDSRLDLRHSHLDGIEIIGGNGLNRANIAVSCLYRINWVNLSLKETNFYRCNLVRAGILSCDVSGAHLVEANMERALLYDSTFDGTIFLGANLTGANLLKADLSGALHLTAEQLSTAGIGLSTKLPLHLQDDAWVQARLTECATWAPQWDWDSLLPPPPAPTGSVKRAV
ncbi:pentapeptide repeat-containing protein [Streptomyces sp. ALI-76-A]|uniref:pentapeptide repeat-containing protein n=1 Tax=Streptomyces sp. ALI-76-A TaxID=3025736 RepID=UPI00256F1BA9|nr:pentapeptide repeat-containing protein [Streptomyces sp. ALI-76-A]MDL5198634.1 pentapeptide repeat-containing protein [Streptomyces sp. ALI-76-A]